MHYAIMQSEATGWASLCSISVALMCDWWPRPTHSKLLRRHFQHVEDDCIVALGVVHTGSVQGVQAAAGLRDTDTSESALQLSFLKTIRHFDRSTGPD